VRDAGFCACGSQVEDRGAGGLGAGASGGGDGDEGFEGFGNGETFAKRRVDEVKKVGVREGSIKIHEFGGVDDGAATDSEEGVRVVGFGKGDGGFDAILVVSASSNSLFSSAPSTRTHGYANESTYELSFGSTLASA
jgi:hypothetical protein